MNVTRLHIELSTRCQASCPMCTRNHYGGAVRSFVGPNDISVEQFTQWFAPDWISQLDDLSACGNYGDPMMNADALAILRYVRLHAPQCYISFHTNASARAAEWWQELAVIIGTHGKVVIAVDGFANTHSLYRIGTDWQRVVQTAKTLIATGITVHAATLAFAHNRDDVDTLREHLLLLGIAQVDIKHTRRFAGELSFPVANGTTLEPAVPNYKAFLDDTTYEAWLHTVAIDPVCMKYGGEIYVDVHGRVWPCCWVADAYTMISDPTLGDANYAQWDRRQGVEVAPLVDAVEPIMLSSGGIYPAMVRYAEWMAIWRSAWTAPRKPCGCAIFCGIKK